MSRTGHRDTEAQRYAQRLLITTPKDSQRTPRLRDSETQRLRGTEAQRHRVLKTRRQTVKEDRIDQTLTTRDTRTELIIGCAIEVHRELGPGLLEAPS